MVNLTLTDLKAEVLCRLTRKHLSDFVLGQAWRKLCKAWQEREPNLACGLPASEHIGRCRAGTETRHG